MSGCAEAVVPDARNVDIPSPISAKKRDRAINERPDSVMYLPLGEDVLVPERIAGGRLASNHVGPFELRSESLAGALQLILADYDISIAFETEEGLTRQVTVANLKGPLDRVVNRVCSLADLYCSYEDETLVVKDVQTFTVTLPPLADLEGGEEFIDDVIQGLTAVIGESGTAPVSDPTTRTLIYSATQRTSRLADNYFQRLRANTAMIVFETYIWEVSLNSGNSTGIDWDAIEAFGDFNASIGINGTVGADFTNPISIGLPTTQAIGASPTDIVEFLSQYGAVKTISQPQITVLSGSEAELRVADTENYVAEVSQTINGDNTTTSVDTDSVDSGFTLTIDSSWDKSTVYANVNVNLTNVDQIEDFTFSDGGATGTDTIIQLPQTTERELTTQVRVRPGDSVLIAGLVRERDNFNSRGIGFMKPLVPDSRTAQTDNLELVILMRPRVVVYTSPGHKKYMPTIDQAIADGVIAPVPSVDLVEISPEPEVRIETVDADVTTMPLKTPVESQPKEAPESIKSSMAPMSFNTQTIEFPQQIINTPYVEQKKIFAEKINSYDVELFENDNLDIKEPVLVGAESKKSFSELISGYASGFFSKKQGADYKGAKLVLEAEREITAATKLRGVY
ncbi:MAG: hypothetical protein AAF244_00735, partial [Pseudomonadota bacterium]